MPSLIRFLTVLGVVGALGFSAVYALATFVTPRSREMVVTIPADDGAGENWLHRHGDVMDRKIAEDGAVQVTVRIEAGRVDGVRRRFDSVSAV
ncbi:hypothetical protein ACIKTA_11410 [Hansschlegelia beijingensis]